MMRQSRERGEAQKISCTTHDQVSISTLTTAHIRTICTCNQNEDTAIVSSISSERICIHVMRLPPTNPPIHPLCLKAMALTSSLNLHTCADMNTIAFAICHIDSKTNAALQQKLWNKINVASRGMLMPLRASPTWRTSA